MVCEDPVVAGGATSRYTVLRQLAAGGMAEIYLARQSTAGGLDRQVVVKRVLPHLASDARIISMFLDEAHTALRLSHPNVVRLFDVGQDERGYFLVMEYLRGRDLAAVERRAHERGDAIPIDIAVQIIVDAARGLEHAHTMTDDSGAPLEIVHRDVSPANLFLTFHGFTKVLDFGIASTRRRLGRTEPGTLKGKHGYMAPEVIEGTPASAASDQFALGVILHELVAGHPLFMRESELATIRAVEALEVPPVSRCPAGLFAVIERLLARAPGDRFPACAALIGELEAIQRDLGLAHGCQLLAGWMDDLFAGEADASEEPAASPGTRPTVIEGRSGTAAGAGRAAGELSDPGFVGRADDLAHLAGAFADGHLLVTLVGTAGIGKTRLARRFLDAELKRGGEVAWADATEARGAAGLCQVVARAIGADDVRAEDADRAVAELGQALRGCGSILIGIDNVEQIAAVAGAALTSWLAAAREARFLVTSRQRLALATEVVHEVGPLALPEEDIEVEGSEAGRLFLARARRARPGFDLGAEERACVAEILRRLEGMPLAIELAAARLSILAPAQLLERLRGSLQALSSRREELPARQAALESAIDWSWRLLGPEEQSVLAQAAVFRGGFLVDSAEAVIAAGAPAGILDIVQSLEHKSLLRASTDPHGERRLGMYESIREFAGDRLGERGERDSCERRHADHFLELGERLAAAMIRHGGLDCLQRLDAERENLAAVNERSLRADPADAEASARAVRAALVLAALVEIRGPSVDSVARLEAALARTGIPDRLRWKAVIALARARRNGQGAHAAAAELEALLPEVQRAGDHDTEGALLPSLGLLCSIIGRPDDARRHLHAARDLHLAHGQADLESETLRLLSGIYMAEDNQRAAAFAEDAVVASRRTGNARVEVRSRLYLAMIRLIDGRLDEARELLEGALELNRSVRDLASEGALHSHLGVVYQETGDLARAEENLSAAVRVTRRTGDPRLIAGAYRMLGQLVWERGRLGQALQVFQRAMAEAQEAGDQVTGAWARVQAAAIMAALGQAERAQGEWAQAHRDLEEVKDREGLAIADIHGGHLRLAAARMARARGDAAAAASSLDEAHRLVAPPAIESDEVRFALRLLRAAVADHEAGD